MNNSRMIQEKKQSPVKSGESNAAILIVDDDIFINRLFKFYLKSVSDGEIISSYDGHDAVDRCLRYQPKLVLMDINMPVKDGITATRDLRAAGFTNPILVVSAYGDSEEETCLEAGADAVICKPVSRDHLLDIIGQHYPSFDTSLI